MVFQGYIAYAIGIFITSQVLFNMAIKPKNGNVFYNCVSPDEQTIQSKLNKSPGEKENLNLLNNMQMLKK